MISGCCRPELTLQGQMLRRVRWRPHLALQGALPVYAEVYANDRVCQAESRGWQPKPRTLQPSTPVCTVVVDTDTTRARRALASAAAAVLLFGCALEVEIPPERTPEITADNAGEQAPSRVADSAVEEPLPEPPEPPEPPPPALPPPPWPVNTRGMSAVQRGQLRLEACWLARVGISENSLPIRMLDVGPEGRKGTGGQPTDDHWAILEVAMNTQYRRDKGYFIEGLGRHAKRVLGHRKKTNHRQEWTSELPCTGDAMPPSWRDQHAENPHRYVDGDWRIAKKLWPIFRGIIVDAVMRGEAPRIFEGAKVQRWGNKDDICMRHNQGWCILPGGDLNFFLAFPGNGCVLTPETNPMSYCGNGLVAMTLPASVAAGRKR